MLGLFSGELIFGGACCWNRKEFCVSKWVGLDHKNSLKHYESSLKQLKTAKSNSPWVYIREGLLWEGFLRRGGGGGGGLIFCGAYYRNFAVCKKRAWDREEGLKHSFDGSHVKRTDSDLFAMAVRPTGFSKFQEEFDMKMLKSLH